MSQDKFTAVPPGITPVQTPNRRRKETPTHIRIVESVETAVENMAKAGVVRVSKEPGNRTRLTEEELTQLLVMLAEGATPGRIQKVFQKRFHRTLSPQTIDKYRDKYKGGIIEKAQELDSLAIGTGLAKRSMRLRRLQTLAEALEERLFTDDGSLADDANVKLLSEYRGVMALIGAEAGDLVPSIGGDTLFVGMNDEDLKKLVAGKLGQQKDLAVILAEKAGVRPTLEKEDADKQSGDSGPSNRGTDSTPEGRPAEVL